MKTSSLILLLALIMSLLGSGCGRKDGPPGPSRKGVSAEVIASMDDYLTHWDHFAQGKEDGSYVKTHTQEFYDRLVDGLKADDPQIMPRCAFFFFVQVFYFLPEDSRLYRELNRISHGELKAQQTKGKGVFLDSAHVWAWWKKHSQEYPDYALLREWTDRPFARETPIPLYEKLNRSR